MPKYPITWLDYSLPTGRQFAIAVCGSSGMICHMFLGNDVLRRTFIRQVNIEGQNCSGGQHCLAFDCPLNHTTKEHISHMLDMHEDETLDAETAKIWGTESVADSLVKFVEAVSKQIPEVLKKEPPIEEKPKDKRPAKKNKKNSPSEKSAE